jgi:glycine hydroxymethyltransferase
MVLTNDKDVYKKINKALFPGIQGGPLMHVILAKAVSFGEALKDDFKFYQQKIVINAKALAAELEKRGNKIVSGGTDTHVFLLDLSNTKITGKAAEKALERVDITVNKNTVPGEKRSPFVTSGIRIGTPAVTTRGMDESNMSEIADLIDYALKNIKDEEGMLEDNIIKEIKDKVHKLTERYPLYKKL